MSENFVTQVPSGEDRERRVCNECGFIDYVNPKLIVGAVCTFEDKILICRRAIEPRVGYWTIPAGYMEIEETAEQGAMREVYEEALACGEINALLGIYSIPRLSQVHMIFRAELTSGACGAGPESMEAKLISYDEIPWNQLAFPTVYWALKHFAETKNETAFAPFMPSPEQMDWKLFQKNAT